MGKVITPLPSRVNSDSTFHRGNLLKWFQKPNLPSVYRKPY